jgi:putative membrane protein
MNHPRAPSTNSSFEPYSITRPAPILMWYYGLLSLLAGPFFLLALVPYYFKYITLRYHFDDKGVSMSWGILWRRETLLTYRRIQDIHLTRNIVERWMGLAKVALQTAAGSATAEMSLVGILEAEGLRDFLYAKMRGARGMDAADDAAIEAASAGASDEDEALRLLRDIRDALAALAGREEARS